ncbi:hypothetical protein ACWCZ5_30945 [Streptomyces sp. NPDC001667]
MTGPDSRLMSAADGGAVQGYNARLAVAGDGVVLAPELVQDANDLHQFQPVSTAVVHAVFLVYRARCDERCPSTPGGCCIASAVSPAKARREEAVARSCGQSTCLCGRDWTGVLLLDNGSCTNENLTAPGPGRLIATGNSRDLPRLGEDLGPLPDADARTRMTHRLASMDGATLCKRRAATVELVNGHLKARTGLCRFFPPRARRLSSRTRLRSTCVEPPEGHESGLRSASRCPDRLSRQEEPEV